MTIFNLDEIEKLEGQARLEAIENAREALHNLSPVCGQPVDRIRWVPVDMVEPNDYNPNSVAKVELGLLYTSILHDGYTQPVVTIWDAEKEKYVIVDGFPINDRMASTVRHNRARGKHSIDGMSNMVFQMLENGWSEAEICAELGMEAEEVLRLKHITGFSKLFEDVEYKKAWESKVQLKLRKQAEKQAAADSAD